MSIGEEHLFLQVGGYPAQACTDLDTAAPVVPMRPSEGRKAVAARGVPHEDGGHGVVVQVRDKALPRGCLN